MRYIEGGKGGTPVEVRASKEVILSGGTYNSPQVLQLSGVGSPELLRSLGIEVRHALPGVGEGLQDHYAPRSVARVKNIRTINELRRGLSLWVEALKWATTRRGLLSLSPTMVYCFWHSGETTESSDLQLTFTPASYKEGVQGQLEDEPGMTIASWQQRPESRGYVRIRSADPFAPPVIQTNYLVEELDRRVVVAGMKLARRLLSSSPLAPYYAYEDFPGPKCRATTNSSPPPPSAAPPRSIPAAPVGWDRRTPNGPWSTTSCVCTVCRDCAWSTPRSCRA